MPTVDLKTARHVAEKFIRLEATNCGATEVPRTVSSSEYYEYHVSTNEVVYEFPLSVKRKEGGFILISGTRRISPVLEFSLDGTSLRSFLTRKLSSLYEPSVFRLSRFLYAGPMCYLAELKIGSDQFLTRIPSGLLSKSKSSGSHYFTSALPQSIIDLQWNRLLGSDDDATPHPSECNPMPNIKCPAYNQTCLRIGHHHISSNSSPPGTAYCKPLFAPTGCIPVAWAMLGATLAANFGFPTFKDTNTFMNDWDTYPSDTLSGGPAVGDEVVAGRINEIRRFMGTSPDGSTATELSWKGEQLFAIYGMQPDFAHQPLSYALIRRLNSIGVPVLLIGARDWTGDGRIDGHGVVVAGYKDFDVGAGTENMGWVNSNMGWGKDVAKMLVPFWEVNNPFGHWPHINGA